MSTVEVKSSGVTLIGLVFVLFLGLKLTGHITWSWWWVTAPLWGPLAIVLALIVVGFVGMFVVLYVKQKLAQRGQAKAIKEINAKVEEQ